MAKMGAMGSVFPQSPQELKWAFPLKDNQREATKLVTRRIAQLLAAKELVSPQKTQVSRLASPQKDWKREGEELVSLRILMG